MHVKCVFACMYTSEILYRCECNCYVCVTFTYIHIPLHIWPYVCMYIFTLVHTYPTLCIYMYPLHINMHKYLYVYGYRKHTYYSQRSNICQNIFKYYTYKDK